MLFKHITLLVVSHSWLVTARPGLGIADSSCRTIPSDASWPSRATWNTLNQSIGGILIENIPIASVCHHTYSGNENPAYNEDECKALRDVWFFPQTHYPSASSPMAYQFTNNSCNPFSDPDSSCTLGSHVVYSINATSSKDLKTGILFAKKHNIRLVIRNTGHDYLGKSTGSHSLALWTHYMKSMELIETYNRPGSNFTGPALKLGAGVQAFEAYNFAHSHHLMVVGGNCPTVGIVGGYIQGGGHGPLSSKHGLAADQVLEWQLVTANGELLTASPIENPDLYWALCGGGGGTYGVVVSMTVKAYPDTYFSTAFLTVPDNGTNTDSIYSAIGNFVQRLPVLVDHGLFVLWLATPTGFLVSPAMAPELNSEELNELMQPTLINLKDLGLEYEYHYSYSPDFLTAYDTLELSWNVSDYITGGRLVPRQMIEDKDNVKDFIETVRYIGTKALFTGVSYNVDFDPDNRTSVNPKMRKAIINSFIGEPIDYYNWTATEFAQHLITHDFMPKMAGLTPGGGSYLNEADVQDPDFQSAFYGDNYNALLEVKDKYDPQGVFYAKTAVGSERWQEDRDGRLCPI